MFRQVENTQDKSHMNYAVFITQPHLPLVATLSSFCKVFVRHIELI